MLKSQTPQKHFLKCYIPITSIKTAGDNNPKTSSLEIPCSIFDIHMLAVVYLTPIFPGGKDRCGYSYNEIFDERSRDGSASSFSLQLIHHHLALGLSKGDLLLGNRGNNELFQAVVIHIRHPVANDRAGLFSCLPFL